MSQPGLFADLEMRGIIKQSTDPKLGGVLAREKITVYAGFDPTADSLHIGHLLPLFTLRRFQDAGHRVIAVVGGATGLIGDPSFKAAERSLLTKDALAHNLRGITAAIRTILKLDGPNPALVVDNAEWFDGKRQRFSYLDFLRDVGKHFTINHMLTKESVRGRLEDREHGISYTEFSYMLLQAYDFYYLNREEGCRLQIGGSDQWGNITAGCELIRRMHAASDEAGARAGKHPEVYGLTFPLITKSDGTKFGKTESGAVWLDPAKTSPYRFYQFLLQTPDADVMQLLKYFTFLGKAELDSLEASLKSEPEKRQAQNRLAQALTAIVHGAEEVRKAEVASKALFSEEIKDLDEAGLLSVLGEAPSTTLPRTELGQKTLVDLLVDTKLCASKGAAKKDLLAGGIYVNNARVNDPAAVVASTMTIAGKFVVLRKGKKNYHLVTFK
ncbi:MAG: tyrosine--tRNA ligase [Bacteriovoracia bacterium]